MMRKEHFRPKKQHKDGRCRISREFFFPEAWSMKRNGEKMMLDKHLKPDIRVL